LEAELEKLEVQGLEEELPETPCQHDAVSKSNSHLDVDSSELPAALLQSIPNTASQSISNVLSELNSTQPAEKTSLMSQYSSHIPATVPAQKTSYQSIRTTEDIPQIPATPVKHNTRNLSEREQFKKVSLS
jgi:hypothetical protein